MLPFYLVFVIAFSLMLLFLFAYVRRVADITLTDQFRAGESIANGRIPEKWIVHINRRITYKGVLPILQPEASGTKLALQKIDKLYRFFENSPFFENAETRDLLLKRLIETRQSWAKMTWEEIEKVYGNGANPAVEDKSI